MAGTVEIAPGSDRLLELLRRTLGADHQLPSNNQPLQKLAEVVEELAEALAEAHHQAVTFSLDSASELEKLRAAFAQQQTDFLSYARQRSICENKPVLGFCGGFSAGKSTFLNVLVNKTEDHPLPTKATRDTALPVFLLSGVAEQLWIENHQGNAFLEAAVGDIPLFRHSETVAFEPWSYLVKSLYVIAPWIRYSEVVYLDLPGHTSGPDDLRLALRAARQCDAIVYLIDVKQGDLKATDVDFLRQLAGLHPPFLILLTKCDLVPPAKLTKVRAQISATLHEQEIPHEGPHLWTKNPDLPGQHQLGLKVVREYAANLAGSTKERRFRELATIAARLAALCTDNAHELKKRHNDRLQQVKDLIGSGITQTIFKKARTVAEASRTVGSFVGFWGFNGSEFRVHHYGQSGQWLESAAAGFPGNLNVLTIWGLYATLQAAIDQSAWYAAINSESPPASDDKWYYEHIQRIAKAYAGVISEISEAGEELAAASKHPIDAARLLTRRAEGLKKQLAQTYQTIKVTI